MWCVGICVTHEAVFPAQVCVSNLLQWNLSAKDTLVPAILSSVERLSSSQRGSEGHPLLRGCPFLRGSFIGGSTIIFGWSGVVAMRS